MSDADFDEIHHQPGRDPVHEVSERPAEDQSQRHLADPSLHAATQEEDEDRGRREQREQVEGKVRARPEPERHTRVPGVCEAQEITEHRDRVAVGEGLRGPTLGPEIEREGQPRHAEEERQ